MWTLEWVSDSCMWMSWLGRKRGFKKGRQESPCVSGSFLKFSFSRKPQRMTVKKRVSAHDRTSDLQGSEPCFWLMAPRGLSKLCHSRSYAQTLSVQYAKKRRRKHRETSWATWSFSRAEMQHTQLRKSTRLDNDAASEVSLENITRKFS